MQGAFNICAQLVWCELYAMKDSQKEQKKKKHCFSALRSAVVVCVVGYDTQKEKKRKKWSEEETNCQRGCATRY